MWTRGTKGIFTQQDPIGIAGGLNLYGFAGGDPVNFSDPFGLKVCFKGTAEQVSTLKEGLEGATSTTIQIDKGNCVTGFEASGEEGFEDLQTRLAILVAADDTYSLEMGEPLGGKDDLLTASSAWFDPVSNTATIGRNAPRNNPYRTRGILGLCHRKVNATLPAFITHELLGHGLHWEMYGRRSSQQYAVDVQNRYHRAVGEAQRCNAG